MSFTICDFKQYLSSSWRLVVNSDRSAQEM